MAGTRRRYAMTRLIAFVLAAIAPALVAVAAAAPEDPEAYIAWVFGSARPTPAETGIRCGLELESLVAANWERLSPAVQALVPDRFRPGDKSAMAFTGIADCDTFIDTEHFRVHYATTPGLQPPGFPDLSAVSALGSHLETAYLYHRDVSGMGVPLPDGGFGGDATLVDFFFYPDPYSDLGWASGTGPVPSACTNAAWGYCVVNTLMGTFDFEDQLRLVAAHEYYHLLQYAHNFGALNWHLESTARNAEFQVWPGIATARGYGEWSQHTWFPLWDTTGLQRYAPHFWFYLEARFDPGITSRIWQRACGLSSEAAIRAELIALGSDLDAVTSDFAVWNYFTGARDDGRHYAPLYGLTAPTYSASFESLPVSTRNLPYARYARPGGTNYIAFAGRPSAADLHVRFDGAPALASQRSVMVVAVNDRGHQAWTRQPDSDGDADFVVPDWGLWDEVALIVANFWDAPWDSSSLDFVFSASEAGSDSTIEAAGGPAVSPNPFLDVTRIVYEVSDPSLSVRIRVYDASGRLVRSLAEGTTFAGRHRLDWDGRDDAGRRAAAGLYLIRVESGSRAATRKVVLTR